MEFVFGAELTTVRESLQAPSSHIYMSQSVNCVWESVPGATRLRLEKEIAAALYHTEGHNAVNILLQKSVSSEHQLQFADTSEKETLSE